MKYDNAVQAYRAEQKKRGIPMSTWDPDGKVYCETLHNARDPFSTDLNNTCKLDSLDSRIKRFKKSFEEQVYRVVLSDRRFQPLYNAAKQWENEPGFGESENKISDAADTLRNYRSVVESRSNDGSLIVESIVTRWVEALYASEQKTVGEQADYSIESLLKNTQGEVFHPLMGYFRNSVREKCDDIDRDIIGAIELELRLKERIRLRSENGGDTQIFEQVSPADTQRHIMEVVAMGARIAAPSVQRAPNEEPREIRVCAYNRILLDNRKFRVKDLIPNGEAVDTVSKYEIHFYNALYNLTPDKLKKFAAPFETETGKKSAGAYHKAYSDYARLIGPDSTRNAAISTHGEKSGARLSCTALPAESANSATPLTSPAARPLMPFPFPNASPNRANSWNNGRPRGTHTFRRYPPKRTRFIKRRWSIRFKNWPHGSASVRKTISAKTTRKNRM